MNQKMGPRFVNLSALGVASLLLASAADIEGTVLIQRRLTKRKVTMPVSTYERGIAVSPESGAETDALAFEKTHVVVYLEGDLPSSPETAFMEQRNKQFVPDLLSISAGSSVSFPNLDPIFHNVFSLSKAKEFDLGNYAKEKTRVVGFPKPGIVFVNCHLHPNMTATIVVSPNAFHTMPDGTGQFQLHGVPPGTYTIVAWHKAAGFFRHTITVAEGKPASAHFFIPLSAEP